MVVGFSGRVRQLRIEKGWTQDRLAMVAGLSYRTIQRIERDGHCSLDSKMALSAAFDVNLNELLNESHSLLNTMFDLTVVIDGKGVYKALHTQTPELLCMPRDEIVGKRYSDVLPGKLADRVSKAIHKLKNGSRLVEFNCYLDTPSGQQYFNVKMVQADKDSFLSVVTEISQQKAREQKQLKNEELLSLVADTLKTGAWEVDLLTMEIVWTKQVYAIYELDETPSIDEGIKYYAREARPVIEQAFNNLIKAGTPYDLQLPFVTAKGKQLQVRVIGLPLFANAEVVKVSGIIQDVTDLKIN